MNTGNDIQDQRTKRKQWAHMTPRQRAASLMGQATSKDKTDAARRNAQKRWDDYRTMNHINHPAPGFTKPITRATAKQGVRK